MPTDLPLIVSATSTDSSGTPIAFYSFTAATPTPFTELHTDLYYTNALLLLVSILLAIDLVRRIFGKHSLH